MLLNNFENKNKKEASTSFSNFIKSLLLLISFLVVSGCVSAPPERMGKFSYEPSYPTNIPETNSPRNGSLFNQGDSLSLFDDSRAHKVGDIITINLSESFNAKKKDEAKYEKTNKQRFGLGSDLTGGASVFGGKVGTGLGAGIGIGYGSDGNFKGKSDVKQNSSLDGSIAVMVVQVISNGNLVIRGEKWITVHDGEEVIRFAGIIRAEDIQPDNTIGSSKVADVRLIYKDVGISGDSSRASAVTQFLHKYWPL